MSEIYACVALIFNENGRILTVARKDDPSKYSFPGGKVDHPEHPDDAVRREAAEEAGITLGQIEPVFEAMGHSKKGLIRTYLAHTYSMTPIAREGHEVRWLRPRELLGEAAAFPDYNFRLFTAVGVTY